MKSFVQRRISVAKRMSTMKLYPVASTDFISTANDKNVSSAKLEYRYSSTKDFTMSFFTVPPDSYNERKMKSARRNGLRHAIFSPTQEKQFKGYYVGEWKNDKKEGKGNELDRDGYMYEGNWRGGKRHGYGVLSKISKNGTAFANYIGEWTDGAIHGFGYHWYENGDYYEGDFYRSKRQGCGHMWHCNGDYYVGSWKSNLYDGMGIYVKANGNRYEGEFVKGKKEGQGVFYHIVTGQQQCGVWKNDLCISAIMSDIYWRQSAIRPTPYPIPRIELAEIVKNIEASDKSSDRTVEIVSYERACKRPQKRVLANICVSRNTCPCLHTVF